MFSSLDDDSTCRICLETGARNSIFANLVPHSAIISYSQMIEYFVSFTIREHDGFPRVICSECISKLETSYFFKKQCEQSYTFLINRYNNENTIDIKHENPDSSNEEINVTENIRNVEIKQINYLKDDSNGRSTIEFELDLNQLNTPEEEPKFNRHLFDQNIKQEYDSVSTLQHSEILNESCKSVPILFAEVSSRKNNGCESGPPNYLRKREDKKVKKIQITKTVKKVAKTDITTEILGIDVNELRTTDKEYQCNQCPRKFKWKRSIVRHLERHLGIKSFYCEICEKYYSRKWQHMQTHVHPVEKKFQCDYCHKMYRNKSVLTTHIMSHSGKKPAKCDMCEKSFMNNFRLAIHKKTHNEREFICQFCSRDFTMEKYLINHIKYKHTNERRHQCTLCEKQFVTARCLKIHEYRHLAIKNFHCDVCDKSFVSRSGLTTHSKMHTKDKPYECRICSVKFKRSDHRNRHEYTAHSVNLSKSKLMD